MAKIEIYSGKAEKVGTQTSIEGNTGQTALAVGQVRTKHMLAFRIDGKPVQFKMGDTTGVSDGDSITCAGKVKDGIMEGYALRNSTTGVTYGAKPVHLYVGLLFIVGIGLLMVWSLILAIIGIPLLIWAPFFYMKGRQAIKARDMVEANAIT